MNLRKLTSCVSILSVLCSSQYAAAQSSTALMAPSQMPETMTPVGQGYNGVIPPMASPDLSDPSFLRALNGEVPLTPNQIQMTKRQVDADQKAAVAPPNGNPTVLVRNISLGLNPGDQPPLLHLFVGNVTTLVFSDVTGQAWPVTSVTVGDKNAIIAAIAGNSVGKLTPATASGPEGSNVVTLQPGAPNAVAENVSVTLQGLDIPVMFQIVIGGNAVDYEVDTTVQKRGPFAADSFALSSAPTVGSPELQQFIDGVPPIGATTLHSSEPDIQAWYMAGQIYVRSMLPLLSPPYISRATSISGVDLYMLPAAPILLVDRDGQPTQLSLTGFPASATQAQGN